MRLFVIGANGRTGTEILDLAGQHGHEITAFVRSPEKLRLALASRGAATRSVTEFGVTGPGVTGELKRIGEELGSVK